MRQGKIALALACACITTTPAAASTAPAGTAKLDPAIAGAGSHLLLDAQGAAGGGFHKQEIPGALSIGFNKGFAFDPAAVGAVCSDDQAGKEQCPPNSIVGTGLLDVLGEGFAFGPNGQQFTAQLTFYRAAPRQAGDPMGIVFEFKETSSGFHGETIGRVMTVDDPLLGTQIQWDKLPIPSLPPGLHFTLERLRIDLGAGTATPPNRVKPAAKKKPNCRRTKRRSHGKVVYLCRHRTKSLRCRKHGKRYLCTKRHTAHKAQDGAAFLTNPAACTGTWRIRLQLAYPSGTETRDADAPCSAAR
jgi:hypothetical protein